MPAFYHFADIKPRYPFSKSDHARKALYYAFHIVGSIICNQIPFPRPTLPVTISTLPISIPYYIMFCCFPDLPGLSRLPLLRYLCLVLLRLIPFCANIARKADCQMQHSSYVRLQPCFPDHQCFLSSSLTTPEATKASALRL